MILKTIDNEYYKVAEVLKNTKTHLTFKSSKGETVCLEKDYYQDISTWIKLSKEAKNDIKKGDFVQVKERINGRWTEKKQEFQFHSELDTHDFIRKNFVVKKNGICLTTYETVFDCRKWNDELIAEEKELCL